MGLLIPAPRGRRPSPFARATGRPARGRSVTPGARFFANAASRLEAPRFTPRVPGRRQPRRPRRPRIEAGSPRSTVVEPSTNMHPHRPRERIAQKEQTMSEQVAEQQDPNEMPSAPSTPSRVGRTPRLGRAVFEKSDATPATPTITATLEVDEP